MIGRGENSNLVFVRSVKVFYHTCVADHHDQGIPIRMVGLKILPNRAIVLSLVYARIYIAARHQRGNRQYK